jgi:hypothetical protein
MRLLRFTLVSLCFYFYMRLGFTLKTHGSFCAKLTHEGHSCDLSRLCKLVTCFMKYIWRIATFDVN